VPANEKFPSKVTSPALLASTVIAMFAKLIRELVLDTHCENVSAVVKFEIDTLILLAL
jgi:hypothetical protein